MSLLPVRCIIAILLFFLLFPCGATSVAINVNYRGIGVEGTVVYLETSSTITPQQKLQVMDQKDKAFVPHIVAVEKGAKVDFPNSDPINHHVYSFSPAKSFSLKLFKDDKQTKHEVQFDKTGIITVGCNIHDWMLGYIFVVDTPYYAVTDAKGMTKLDIPDGVQGQLKIWHPRFNQQNLALTHTVDSTSIIFNLPAELLPDPRPKSRY